jgi:hypothetical protein
MINMKKNRLSAAFTVITLYLNREASLKRRSFVNLTHLSNSSKDGLHDESLWCNHASLRRKESMTVHILRCFFWSRCVPELPPIAASHLAPSIIIKRAATLTRPDWPTIDPAIINNDKKAKIDNENHTCSKSCIYFWFFHWILFWILICWPLWI